MSTRMSLSPRVYTSHEIDLSSYCHDGSQETPSLPDLPTFCKNPMESTRGANGDRDEAIHLAKRSRSCPYSQQASQTTGFTPTQAQIPPPSSEQELVLASLEAGYNVQLNSVAGSGKTTTALQVAQRFPHKTISLMTYNAMLKAETRVRRGLTYPAITNMPDVHSFHSFGYMYYDKSCCRDHSAVLAGDTPPTTPLKHMDILVIDEAQDLAPQLFAFVRKVLKDYCAAHGHLPQLVVIGDENQTIFQFQRSDKRYLTLSDRLFPNGREWRVLRLSVSYRITPSMSRFVNEVLLSRPDHTRSHKADVSTPVRYVTGNSWSAARYFGREIVRRVCEGVAPEDILLLAPSIKPKSSGYQPPIMMLENILARMGLSVHKQLCDDDSFDEKVARNKIAMCTFHKSKGLERRYVYAFNFNKSYFKYYDQEADKMTCPATMYVAATRAQCELTIIGEGQFGEHLPFLNRHALYQMSLGPEPAVEIMYFDPATAYEKLPTPTFPGPCYRRAPATTGHSIVTPAYQPASEEKVTILSAQKLVAYLPAEVLTRARACLTFSRLDDGKQPYITLPRTCESEKDTVEAVAVLNGLAIPAMLEVQSTGCCAMYSALLRAEQDCENKMNDYVRERLSRLRPPHRLDPPSVFLELAAVYSAGASINNRGFISELTSLTTFDWMDQALADKCRQRLEHAVPNYTQAYFEVVVENHFNFRRESEVQKPLVTVLLQGQLDIVAPDVVWEIKCISGELSTSHLLQVAIYAWLWMRVQPTLTRRFRLLNVLSGEMWELTPDPDQLDRMMQLLLRAKLDPHQVLADEQFLEDALALRLIGCALAQPSDVGQGCLGSPYKQTSRIPCGIPCIPWS